MPVLPTPFDATAAAPLGHGAERQAGRVPGSFRDPDGYVFWHDGRVFRALSPKRYATLRRLDCGILPRLIDDGLLVGTRFVDDRDLRGVLAVEQSPARHFLEHDVVAPITYPCEWSISMLADAAALTLDLQLRLLAAGHGLKDASAYNVQFVGGRPAFIDVASIERAERLDVWPALDQFQRMFTLPLLLCRHHGWDPRSCFLPAPQGRSVEEAARIVGPLRLAHPRYWLDLTLPCMLAGWGERLAERPAAAQSPGTGTDSQLWNLTRLRRKVLRLAAGYRPRGRWSDYTRSCGYDDVADRLKRTFVGDVLGETRPVCVLDLGCNTGEYSRLAARHAPQVVAIDGDHDTIELLYRDLRERPAPIVPIVCDLLAPTPAIGFRNTERPALFDRVQADCVLALALVHHLLVRGNLSLALLCDQLHDLTTRDLIVEHIAPDDPMFRRLARGRHEQFCHLDLARFRAVFSGRFRVLRETAIPHTCRTLLWLRRKDADDSLADAF